MIDIDCEKQASGVTWSRNNLLTAINYNVMTNNQLLYVKFFLRTTKKSPEIGMLYLRISYNTKRVDFSFNHRVNISSWESSYSNVNQLGRINSSTITYKRIYPTVANAIEKREEVWVRYQDEVKLE